MSRRQSIVRSLCSALVIALAVGAGCAAATRDRLKQFFFEVPAPGDAPPISQHPSEPVPRLAPTASADFGFRSVHPPYAQRACDECHNPDDRMHPRADLAESCESCHDRYFTEEAAHFPVAEGDCALCHEMHKSKLPALLRASVVKLCVDCHGEVEDLSEEAHRAESVENCTACHDPHFGSDKFLKPDRPKP